MKKIEKWLIRLVMWIFSGCTIFDLILLVPNGSDYMHPFAPSSFDGIPRKEFLKLYKKQKNGKKISLSDHYSAKYSNHCYQNLPKEAFLEANDRSIFVYQYFLSPWKRNRWNN